ncbi:precorrin-3B synthase [Acidimangrovimonas sediminis]|uniref:precorrin-3B synthase n=1 Tax=Acidimangrovimonas sediminis TaxID=2056283 RepID=UPI000C80E734|nr:precorrin-3B synthase [Acidimangrovimonas sediminis]
MTGFEIRGHCPGALRPMASADGLVVRIRPPLGVLTPAQARGLAPAAQRFGSAVLELTSRANLQIRGVPEAAHPALIAALSDLGLIDPDPATERARNLVVTPFHRDGDGTANLGRALTEVMLSAPPLPAKFGVALDCGTAPVLGATPADIRIERDGTGALLLRPDGLNHGRAVLPEEAPDALRALLDWFAHHGVGEDGRGRMRDAAAGLCGYDTLPAPAEVPPGAGPAHGGMLVAVPFGQMPAETLAALADAADELRLTPWRALFLPGVTCASALPEAQGKPGLITDPDDPLLRTHACTGAPGCPQAHAETRPLARALAAHLRPGQQLHVSGCAKGCAHPAPADLTITAGPEGYALARNARAGDPPHRNGLDARALTSLLHGTDDATPL